MDGSVLAPLCFSHPQWQELQGMRAIMPMPRGSRRDLRDLSTWINVGRFFCLSEGEPASFQKSCSPISTGRATGHCCELGQALYQSLGSEPWDVPLQHTPITTTGEQRSEDLAACSELSKTGPLSGQCSVERCPVLSSAASPSLQKNREVLVWKRKKKSEKKGFSLNLYII